MYEFYVKFIIGAIYSDIKTLETAKQLDKKFAHPEQNV